jgi:hypothetical protein
VRRSFAAVVAALLTVLVASAGTPAAAAPLDPQPGTQFGALVQVPKGQTYQQALAASESRYGRLKIVRFFGASAPPSWASLTSKLGDRPAIISFRIAPATVLTGSQDAAITTWFRSAPTDRPTYWTYMHEPEDDIARGSFTAAQYRDAYARIAALATAAANPMLRATLILMCYTVNPTSNRTWTNYYAAGSVQVLAWDCYNHKWRSDGYGTPEKLLGRAVAVSESTGLEWGIAELGSVKVSSDPTGSKRAAWLTASGNYLIAQGASFVAYFDTNGKKTDYRLLDAPSIAAWRAFVSPS